ncbi:MAG TPA: hypothetical protein VFA20_30660 [Myxococcaceae bacterium]|nr:hypothetical protein [Myxococcaceae bacterium]
MRTLLLTMRIPAAAGRWRPRAHVPVGCRTSALHPLYRTGDTTGFSPGGGAF